MTAFASTGRTLARSTTTRAGCLSVSNIIPSASTTLNHRTLSRTITARTLLPLLHRHRVSVVFNDNGLCFNNLMKNCYYCSLTHLLLKYGFVSLLY